MKPKAPLPKYRPFLTILTNTYMRPKGLEANLKSVYRQTIKDEIEQIVIPDHLGVSPADAVYGRLHWYLEAIRGEYVHVLGDDDVLADDTVVAQLKARARQMHNPSVIVLKCQKGDQVYPKTALHDEYKEGDIDLCNLVIRRDCFKMSMMLYAQDYKCDWDFFQTLGREYPSGFEALDLLFAVGRVGGGRPEAVAW